MSFVASSCGTTMTRRAVAASATSGFADTRYSQTSTSKSPAAPVVRKT